jgi:hypothetical protein
MNEAQHAMLVWAIQGLGWKHGMTMLTTGGTTMAVFRAPGGLTTTVDMVINPFLWPFATTHELRLRLALETAIDTQRICLNGGFDPRNPPRADQEEQDVQDARHDQVQQDEGRSHPDPEGPAELRG